jgi:flagellar operon protein
MIRQMNPLQRTERPQQACAPRPQPSSGPGFAEVLRSKVEGLRFSAHAQSRLASRNISVSAEMMSRLENAVSGAEKKGSKESLVLLANLAFIVNVPNKVVVTAME